MKSNYAFLPANAMEIKLFSCGLKEWKISTVNMLALFGTMPKNFNEDFTPKPGVSLKNIIPFVIMCFTFVNYFVLKSYGVYWFFLRGSFIFSQIANEIFWLISDAIVFSLKLLLVSKQSKYLSAIRQIQDPMNAEKRLTQDIMKSRTRFFLFSTIFAIIEMFVIAYRAPISKERNKYEHDVIQGILVGMMRPPYFAALTVFVNAMVWFENICPLEILMWASLMIDSAAIRIRKMKWELENSTEMNVPKNVNEIISVIKTIHEEFERFLSPLVLLVTMHCFILCLGFVNLFLSTHLSIDCLPVPLTFVLTWMWANEGRKIQQEVITFLPKFIL